MTRPLLRIDRDQLLQLERSMSREWLETDGVGGYASSTVLLCPTRRYHGLLVAPFRGTAKRHVFLSRFDETLNAHGKSFALSMTRYRGLFHPLGHLGIDAFELRPNPAWVYQFGSARIEREVLMVRGESTVLTRYSVRGAERGLSLRLRPLLPFREADALTVENFALDKRVDRVANGIACQLYGALPALFLRVSCASEFTADPVWYQGIEYATDLARGYEGHEDNYSPGFLEIPLEEGRDVIVAASIALDSRGAASLSDEPSDVSALWDLEKPRRSNALSEMPRSTFGRLALSAEDFLQRTEGGRLGIVAGYPWFGEWGRDDFVALPGLTLARGRRGACREVLEGAVRFVHEGLVPNIFGEAIDTSRYNSVDASLWFARAVRLYELDGVHVRDILREFLPALLEIATRYLEGTALGIVCDDGGLIRAGGAHLNATWMDAETQEGPVTPRDGYAVEINALWYQLVAYLEYLLRAEGRSAAAKEWGRLKQRAGASFLERFWLADEGCLADVWNPHGADRSLRPNMVIAAALEWSPLTQEQRAEIVRSSEAHLLTPFGLRTLGPRDPRYQGRYGGGTCERDHAYHQGTVWPWLLGFHVEAWLRAFGDTPATRTHLRALFVRFPEHLDTAGLNHVSEVFDGDPPHRPGGAIAQAWSSGELLRALKLIGEDVR